MNAVLIFPNQLYYSSQELQRFDQVILFEDPLFFYDQTYKVKFHKQKLILHRASMKCFWDNLDHPKKSYVEWASKTDLRRLLQYLQSQGIDEIQTADPVDYVLEKRIKQYTSQLQQKLYFLPNRLFINSKADNQVFLLRNPQKKLFFTKFYIYQRQRLNILLQSGKPTGGKWSFDIENRKRLPKNAVLPNLFNVSADPSVFEAQRYVEQHFADHVGQSAEFFYPVKRHDALAWLDEFIKSRLTYFGNYEDAIDQDNHAIYHSLLSPLLNIGLLLPQDVIDRVDEYMKANPDYELNTVEGFLRQIIGWREFIRLIYERSGVTQRTTNALHHHRHLNEVWYTAQTQLLPVDSAVQALQRTAYTHHIERLMILGNVMVLCEVHPDQVYKWFMEMFIDAYDWVMVPNVYGMSQYADGGLMTTKPYISGSSYILKMSNYSTGNWTEIWDGLFWRFVNKHQNLLRQNMRMRFMVNILEKMDEQKKNLLFDSAEEFILRVTNRK
jgi:deoxyribodipyrimidine photolyase-related protein